MDLTIRKQVEGILQLHITGDNWKDTWQAAEQQGKMTGSRTNKILMFLCEAVEKLQNAKNE